MEERPTKRPRQKQEGCRDDHLYLDDGNIVLSALDTDDGVVYFRVHRSVLSRQSPVFKDMFNIPTGDSVEKYDGVPLVRLHDGADDVKDFLRALYDPDFLPFSRLSHEAAAVMLGPLKLATKYLAETLRARIIKHLEHNFPNTLASYDAMVSERMANVHYLQFNPVKFGPDPAIITHLAHTCDVPSLLPTAFYLLSTRRHTDDIDTIVGDPKGPNALAPSSAWSLLTVTDLHRLMVGKERIARWLHKQLWDVLEPCCKNKDTILLSHELFWDCAASGNVLEILNPLKSYMEDIIVEYSLCLTCSDSLKDRVSGERQEFWGNIAGFFELAPIAT